MPTYDYLCNICGAKFENFQSMSSPILTNHPDCKSKGNNVTRLVSGGTGLIFKGSGFYLTDYGKKKTEKSKPDGEPKKSSDTKINKTTKSKNKSGETNK